MLLGLAGLFGLGLTGLLLLLFDLGLALTGLLLLLLGLAGLFGLGLTGLLLLLFCLGLAGLFCLGLTGLLAFYGFALLVSFEFFSLLLPPATYTSFLFPLLTLRLRVRPLDSISAR